MPDLSEGADERAAMLDAIGIGEAEDGVLRAWRDEQAMQEQIDVADAMAAAEFQEYRAEPAEYNPALDPATWTDDWSTPAGPAKGFGL